MRTKEWIIAALTSATVGLCQVNLLNFSPVERRQSCPANYFSCDSQGAAYAGICCQNGQLCALDSSNQPGCCPSGAVCTGTVPPSTATAAVSFVSNAYFAFPYIPTSFPNSAACTSAVSQCSQNYDSCASNLQGAAGGLGVTIVVPGGGGTTIAATRTTVAPTSATSICSSLSSEACHNLQSSQCASFTGTGGFVVGGNAAAGPTPACMVGVMAGLGLGIMAGHL